MFKSLYQKINISKILFTALFLRLISWPWTYHGDVNATYWWGRFASEFNWRGFYDWLNFGGHAYPDQPMLNIYYDWFIRQIYLFFYNIFWYLNTHISVFPSNFMQWYFLNGNQYLLKLPMILADILLVYFCYKFTKSKKIALVLALFPPLIYNSAVWGSGDSIIILFALLALYLFRKEKYLLAIFLYTLSVLYKSSLLIWFPIIMVILVKNKISFKKILLSIISILILIYLISFRFNPVEINPILWFFSTMFNKVLPGIMDQVTANAMNFWAIIYTFKPTLDGYQLLNFISLRQLSLFICLLLYIYQIRKLLKNYSLNNLLLTLATISLTTFTFMTRMHERYTLPALIPLLLLSYYDRRFTKYFILFTLTHIINVYGVWGVPNIVFIKNILNNDFFIRFVSLLNTLLSLKLIFFNLKIKNTESHQSSPTPPKG